ncbi:TapY2 family type IVa secretion system protein [Pseudoalteromonas pernae]|uniref:TapY2 family type IVa secretion system protein n=1 Tax=Pseudoalteromonas pernae TaxID=3118054 RepID=UPI003242B82C
MNILIRFSLLSFALMASSTVLAEKFNPYKCYVLLENNTFAVIDVEVKQKSLSQASKAAIAEGHKYPGQKVQKVAQVVQCVQRSDEFTDSNARELDKNKLR